MKHVLLIGSIVVSSLMATVWLFRQASHSVERSQEPLKHDAYIWQRQWDDDLVQAVKRSADQIHSLCLLTAEVSYTSNSSQVVRIPIDFSVVNGLDRPIGLALRIGPYAGAYDRQIGVLEALAVDLIETARAGGVEPAELQIDFDCAESKLSGYCQWLQAIRKRIEPVPLIFTALPCWLAHRDFRHLARSADGFVLQVHSLALPTGQSRDMTLCDGAMARHWVEQAAQSGVDFRVALPTYGYVVGFDPGGKCLGLSAEGPSRTWPIGTDIQVVRSDPVAMADLVQQFAQDRPKHCTGLIWYRLPVAKDRLNWRWVTLSAVMAGRAPDQQLRVEVEYPEPALVDIVLVNPGEVDMNPNVRVEIDCHPSQILGSDSLRGFVVTDRHESRVCLVYHGTGPFDSLAPGERRKIAWFRFKEELEIDPNVILLAHQH